MHYGRAYKRDRAAARSAATAWLASRCRQAESGAPTTVRPYGEKILRPASLDRVIDSRVSRDHKRNSQPARPGDVSLDRRRYRSEYRPGLRTIRRPPQLEI